jgi:hypothetical protein
MSLRQLLDGLGDDSTAIDTSSIPSDSETASAGGSTVSYEPAVAATTLPAGFTADPNVVKGLQNAINRFYGVTIGSPLTVDGIIGPQTVSAIGSIMAWMPGAGYDPSALASLIGSSPTIDSVSLQAASASNVIDWVADQNNFTVGVTPSIGSLLSSAPAPVKTQSGLIVPASIPTTGTSQTAATTFLGLGIPNWVYYIVGGLVVAGVVVLAVHRIHKRGLLGLDDDDGGDDSDDELDGLDDKEYEVHHDGKTYSFPNSKRAKAQAKLLEREYGGQAHVTQSQ